MNFPQHGDMADFLQFALTVLFEGGNHPHHVPGWEGGMLTATSSFMVKV